MVDFSNMQLNDNEPVYIQIAKHLKRLIFLRQVASGETMPSRREMAAQLGINPNTAQKAFRLLEEEGCVRTLKNAPSTVYYDDSVYAKIKEELTRGLVLDFVKTAKENELSFHTVIALLTEEWEKE